MTFKLKNIWLKLGASATVFALQPYSAYAVVDVNTVQNQLAGEIGSVSKILTVGAYIAGAGLGTAGVVGLKKHADNPGQNQLGPPVGKLFAGGALIVIPYILAAASGSITNTNAAADGGIKTTYGAGAARF